MKALQPARTYRDHARQRGSIMLLVVVSAVLMAILGISYMQVVRVQRQTTVRAQGDIEAVKRAIVAQILQVATKDVLDDQGNFLMQDSRFVDSFETRRDEPYDHPWTNPNPGFSDPAFTSVLTGALLPTVGGILDDKWLASTSPVRPAGPGSPYWTHLTNLGGHWLLLPKPDNLSNIFHPEEIGTTATPGDHASDTDVTIFFLSDDVGSDYLAPGADASGNGIPDSRWQWAPLVQINGVAYVMAVRIVDLSALANANVAMAQTNSAGVFDQSADGTNAPRWWYPTELDLGGPVYEIANANPGWMAPSSAMSELNDLLRYRMNNGAGAYLPTPWGFAARERSHFWLHAGRYTGPLPVTSPYQQFTIADELALRWREGLARQGVSTAIEDEMPGFLRRNAVENSWQDVLVAMGRNAAAADAIVQYYENESRHQFTVLGGRSLYAMPLPGETDRVIKQDLNFLLRTPTQGPVAFESLVPAEHSLIVEIDKVLSAGANFTVPTGSAAALGKSAHPAGTLQYARQMAANLVDYADDDNKLTLIDAGEGEPYYGMEALPFISEVYVQGKYDVTALNPPAPPGPYVVTWTQTGNIGYAIEIRNPFNVPVDISTVELWINGTQLGTLSSYVTLPDNMLAPNEVLIFYRKSVSDAATDDDDIFTNLVTTEAGYVNHPVELTTFLWPQHSNAPGAALATGDVTVELRATIYDPVSDTDSLATWAYNKVVAHALPDTYDEPNVADNPGPPPTPAIGNSAYMQRTRVGAGNGINVLAYAETEFFTGEQNPSVTTSTASSTLDALGMSDKSTISTLGDRVDEQKNQWLFADRGTFASGDAGPIAYVGELMHLAVIGPSPAATVGEAWSGRSDITGFMLDLDATSLIGDDNYAINHAQMLLERFVTFSPLTDDVDNDGIGTPSTDNEEEVFVPGTFNINTASETMIARVLPITNTALREEVARRIVAFRDNPNRGTQPLKGIAHVSELWDELAPLMRGGHGVAGVPDFAGTDVDAIDGTRVDFISNPDATQPDGVTDDREQELMLLNWLTSVCTTRSDRFVAYVLVHGYPAGDFRNGGDGPLESARFFFVFDRGALVDEDSTATVIGNIVDVE